MKTPVIALSVLAFLSTAFARRQVVADAPEVTGPFTLIAAYDPQAGHNAFSYAGRFIPPTIRVLPGQAITLHYANNLPVHSTENCALGPCADHTNLHFHGLHVSPESPQDDVLTMMAMPGQSLNYRVNVPSYAPPGLYWYHTHAHGESARQDLDGMSGAIVVDGIDRYYPGLRGMDERILDLRDNDIEHESDEVRSRVLRQVDEPPAPCGTQTEQRPERVFTVNGAIRPEIPMAPGKPQFWRIVNASPDRYADLQVDGQQLDVVALDGMPLSYHDPGRPTMKVDHILIAPAGRVEAVVTGPPPGRRTVLRTRCIDTGPDGDPNPPMVIADVFSDEHGVASAHQVPPTTGAPIYRTFPVAQTRSVESSAPDFTVVFTEDKNGFYINGKKFALGSPPMLTVNIGALHHWRVVNATRELHPFHIHQVHFLVYAVNGIAQQRPEWLDTVNVPYGGGTVDLVMDFTDPIIRGMSVFHCHLLSHEDKGMMAGILFR